MIARYLQAKVLEHRLRSHRSSAGVQFSKRAHPSIHWDPEVEFIDSVVGAGFSVSALALFYLAMYGQIYGQSPKLCLSDMTKDVDGYFEMVFNESSVCTKRRM